MFLATVLAGFSSAYVAQRIAGDRAFSALNRSANESLALQAETLEGMLEKYRLLPPLLSRREDIKAVFEDPWGEANRAAAAGKAIEIAGFSGARDIAFADSRGRIFASARGIFDGSEVQQSTLFEAARQRRLGREAISAVDGEPSYVFASSVNRGTELLGVIAVYVRFDQIEATWALAGSPIVATDAEGRVFLSNTELSFEESWHGKLLHQAEEDSAAILSGPGGDHSSVFRINETGGLYLEVRRSLPLLNWTLHVFKDYRPVETAKRTAALISAMAAALAGLVAWFLVKRREALVQRMRLDHAAALRLERRVRDRTRELSHEVEERKRTEIRLRETQNELVQAAKLAALGQMSAALSHEFNQPLAAIGTQADNARRLVGRDDKDSALEALGRITGLVERMSELSRTLLTFARKPGTAVEPVLLRPILDEAMVLAGPKAKNAGVRVDYGTIGKDLKVMGGRIRLTQVFVNLINNAVDAMSGANGSTLRGQPLVSITAKLQDGEVLVTVNDNGPGIEPLERNNIFDPFYTTKDVGEGLGIGLSVVFNIVKELGGNIRVADTQTGGACFEIRLLAAGRYAAETKPVAAK